MDISIKVVLALQSGLFLPTDSERKPSDPAEAVDAVVSKIIKKFHKLIIKRTQNFQYNYHFVCNPFLTR